MKQFKKVLVLLFAVIFAFTLVGCNKGGSTDLDLLNEYADKIYLGKLDKVNNDIQLPKFAFGNQEFTVTWKSDNETVIKVQDYEDEELKASYYQAYVEMAKVETKVNLTATVKYKEETVERVFEVTVVADEYTGYDTIAEAKAVEGKEKDVSTVKFNGVVTAVTKGGFVVTDDTASFYCFGSNHGRKVGEKVTVRGNWTYYNNMVQVKNASVKVTGVVKNFNIADYAETMDMAKIAAIKPEKIDALNTTRMFKTKVAFKSNAAGSYNVYRIQDPKDANIVIDLSKYNDPETLEEVKGYADNGKFYEVYIIFYCSRNVAEGTWDALYVPGTAKEVEITLTDAEKVAGVVNDLRNQFDSKLVNDNLTLPVKDENTGATIAWASDNEGIISNAGVFTAPTKKTIVTLTATITLNDTVETVEIKVTAKAAETHKNYISDARAKVEKDPVANTRVEGVVTNKIGRTFYIQDGDSAIMIYNLPNEFKVGDNVYVEGGIVKVFNGLYEIDKTTKDVEDRTAGYTKNVYTANPLEVTEFTKEALVGSDNALVTIYNVEYVKGTMQADQADKEHEGSFKPSNITFKDAKGNEFTLRTDKYMDKKEAAALNEKINALKAGDKVSIVNANIGWFNKPQITPSLASQLQGVNTIKAARNSYVDKDIDNVTIEGKVTNVAGNTYYVQDGYYAIMVYNQKDHGLVEGDTVKVTGTLTVYNGLYEMKNCASEKIEKVFDVFNLVLNGVNYNKESLEGKDNALVSFENLTFVEGKLDPATDPKYVSGYKSTNIKFEASNGTKVTLRNDAYISAEDGKAIADLVNALKPGDIVSVRDANLGWFKGPQITITNVNQLHVNTVANARNLYVDKDVENVTIKGVVTAVIGNTYYVQDGDYALMAYNQKDNGLVAGDNVEVTGTLTVYNGLYELKGTTSKKIEEKFTANTVVLTGDNYDKESLKGFDNSLVAAYNLVYVEGQMQSTTEAKYVSGYKASNIKFKIEDGTEAGTIITVRTDAYMNAEKAKAMDEFLKTLVAGDIVNIDNCVLGWFKGPQVTPVDVTTFTKVTK